MKTGLVGTILLGFALLAMGNSVLAQDPPYNYAEALQKGLFFYAAQLSGEANSNGPGTQGSIHTAEQQYPRHHRSLLLRGWLRSHITSRYPA